MDFLCKDMQLEQLMPVIKEQLQNGKHIRYSPRGISMLPMIREGRDSVVLAQVPEQLHKYDIALYQRSDGQYVLHRIVKAEKTYTCIGDNQYFYEPGIEHRQVIAVVTAFYRSEKRYSTTHWVYKLYCRLWHFSRGLRHLFRRIKRRIERQ